MLIEKKSEIISLFLFINQFYIQVIVKKMYTRCKKNVYTIHHVNK